MNSDNHGFVAHLAIVCVLLAVSACGGGGGSSQYASPPDTAAPSVSIASPANGVVTKASTLSVTGTASDNVGVISVTVNGTAATSSDGYATWSASIALNAGSNSITVSAKDAAGNVGSATATLISDQSTPQASLLFPPAPAHTDANRLTVTGTSSDNVAVSAISVNGVAATSTDNFATWHANVPLTVGANSILVNATDSAGNVALSAAMQTVTRHAQPPIVYPYAITVDHNTDQAWLLDFGMQAIFKLSLSTGSRTLISDATHGTGQPFTGARSLTRDPASGTLYVTDSNVVGLFRI